MRWRRWLAEGASLKYPSSKPSAVCRMAEKRMALFEHAVQEELG